jgi:CRP/FNR family transcriptional regulator, cyclic AMP receptor protein
MTDLNAALAGVHFLSDQPQSVRDEIAKMAVTRHYPRGNILFYHGDPGSMMYIVIEGQIKISVISEDGREVVVAFMRTSNVCGLISALDGGRHVGTATTVTDSHLAAIPAERFLGWLRNHPTLHQSLLMEMAQMIRAAYEKVGEQALLPVKKRLLTTLVEIAREEGQQDDAEVVFIRPTHQELAERIGTTRVVVCRALKELLEEEGVVQANGRVLRVRLTALHEAEQFS